MEIKPLFEYLNIEIIAIDFKETFTTKGEEQFEAIYIYIYILLEQTGYIAIQQVIITSVG